MAHFAEIDVETNIVKRVVVVSDEYETYGDGFLTRVLGMGGTWLQCSYNGNIRGCFPGIGSVYDPINDVFVGPVVEP